MSVKCCVLMYLLVYVVDGDNEHYRAYLEQKWNYLGHFGEMLRRKNEQYYTKRQEYSSWLTNYHEMEKENHRVHTEEQDERHEIQHEHSEVARETHREQHHGGYKRSFIKKGCVDMIKTPNEALHFFKRRRNWFDF